MTEQKLQDSVLARTTNIKPGDLVYGYEKGIHRVVAITTDSLACSSGIHFHLHRVLNSNYIKGKGKSSCDAAWVRLVNKEELLAKIEAVHTEVLSNIHEVFS